MAYSCPLCGAEANRKGRPFESVGAVVGHIDAKRDDLHADESGAAWRPSIVRSSSTVTADDADDTSRTAAGGTQDDALSHETHRAAAEADPSPQQDPAPSETAGSSATAATATLTTPDDDATADVERRTQGTTNAEPSPATMLCPRCGASMDGDVGGELLTVRTGGWIFPKGESCLCDDTDFICRECDTLYTPGDVARDTYPIMSYDGQRL